MDALLTDRSQIDYVHVQLYLYSVTASVIRGTANQSDATSEPEGSQPTDAVHSKTAFQDPCANHHV